MRGTVVRSAVVLGLLLVPASGWAHTRQAPDDRAPIARSGGAFTSPAARAVKTGSMFAAGAFADPLPATSRNMELVGKLPLKTPDEFKFDLAGAQDSSQPDLVPGQIADVAVFKNFAYLASWSEPTCKRGGVLRRRHPRPREPGADRLRARAARELPRRGHARGDDHHAAVLGRRAGRQQRGVRHPARAQERRLRPL